jgi:hypothetical protein
LIHKFPALFDILISELVLLHKILNARNNLTFIIKREQFNEVLYY